MVKDVLRFPAIFEFEGGGGGGVLEGGINWNLSRTFGSSFHRRCY